VLSSFSVEGSNLISSSTRKEISHSPDDDKSRDLFASFLSGVKFFVFIRNLSVRDFRKMNRFWGGRRRGKNCGCAENLLEKIFLEIKERKY
jgi:hypothetical protein